MPTKPVRDPYAGRLTRGIVLNSLFPGWSRGAWDQRTLLRRVGAVRSAQIKALRAAGWNRETVSSRPCSADGIGGFGRRKSRPYYCRRALICPFCWARQFAFKAYRRLLPLLGEPDVAIVLISARRRLAMKSGAWDERSMRRLLAAARASVQSHAERMTELHRCGAWSGAAVFHRVWPLRRAFGLARTTVAVVPGARAASIAPPPHPAPGRVETAVYPATARGLYLALSRAFAYKPSLLSAEAGEVRLLLESLHHVRMLSFCGPPRAARRTQ